MILGLTFRSNLKMLLLCTVLAVSLHKSMMLLAAAGACAWFITDTRYYVAAWVGSIWPSFWRSRHRGDDRLLRLFR